LLLTRAVKSHARSPCLASGLHLKIAAPSFVRWLLRWPREPDGTISSYSSQQIARVIPFSTTIETGVWTEAPKPDRSKLSPNGSVMVASQMQLSFSVSMDLTKAHIDCRVVCYPITFSTSNWSSRVARRPKRIGRVVCRRSNPWGTEQARETTRRFR
jgi:hypothetical protein